MNIENGRIISDRYEILEKIGAGGMAIVYRARDKKLERFVTVKVLREEFITDEEFKARFKIEARSAASLSHPNIVNVYDVGEDGNVYYIVMEYVHGDTLKKAIIEKAPFDTKSTVNVAIQMASALSHAHKNHIVHRDIKPQNILVATDGMIKVTDFGIARAATAATMTTTANAIGSVHYFSPEQARGGYVDEKSDIYSLGITMFEMITGRLPYDGDTSVAIALKHINEELPNIREYNANVSRSLEGIIKKATRKKADERYATIELLLADLIKARSNATGDFIEGSNLNAAEAPTVEMPSKELQYIQNTRKKKTAESIEKEETPIRGFERYNKKIRISKDNEYEEQNYEEKAYEENKYHTDPYEELDEPYEELDEPYEENDYEPPVYGDKKRRLSASAKKRQRKNSYDDEYENYDRSQEKKVIIAAIVTAAVIIIIISIIGIKIFGKENNTPDVVQQENEITMPLFLGETFESAQKTAEGLNISVVKSSEEYSNEYDLGEIMYQSVKEGEKVAKDTVIQVKVSIGAESVQMPDVLGKEEKTASGEISKLIGKEPDITFENSEDVEVGKVISQNPSSGKTITSDTAVSIVVSRGEEAKKITVPNVEGKALNGAKKELTDLGLKVGTVTEIESTKVEKGVIVTQTVKSGEEVAKNSIVNLVVSKGSAQTPPTQTPAENEDTTPQPPADDTVQTPPAQTPADNIAPPTQQPGAEPSEEPADQQKSSTRVYSINPPSNNELDTVHIKVLKIDENGATTVVLDTEKTVSQLPMGVSVTGTGKAEIQCYIDEVQQWSENVNFSEGGN